MLNGGPTKRLTAQKLGIPMSGFLMRLSVPFLDSQAVDEGGVVTGVTPRVEGQSAVGMAELTASHAFG